MSLGIPSAGLQVLFALVALVWLRSRPAVLALGAILLGSLSLVPWLPNLLAIAGNGHTFWTSRPDLGSLGATVGAWFLGGLGGWWVGAAVVAGCLALLGSAALCLGNGFATSGAAADRRSRRSLVLVLVLAASLVFVVWGYSQIRSIYDPRYFGSSFPPFAILVSAGVGAITRFVRFRWRNGGALSGALGLTLVTALVAPMLLGAGLATDAFRQEDGVDPARQVVSRLSSIVRPGDVVMTLNAQSYFPLEYYLTRTGEASRLGVELYHWHRPTAAFFTGWEDIDPARVVDQARVDAMGWERALHLSGSSRIWLVTLNNPDYEFPLFAPAQTGSLKVLGSTELVGNGVTAEIWESVPSTS